MPRKQPTAADRKLLEEAKRNLKLAFEAESAQRSRERGDLRFQIGEYQWSEEARASNSGDAMSGGLPPRPLLSVPKLDQPRRVILNQFRSSHLGVNIQPRNEKANKDTAEVQQGLYRLIEEDSGATAVRAWALDRAVQCGSGAYEIVAEYDDDTDNPFDQKLAIRRIFNQSLVYFDPAAEMPDRSDGRWAFKLAWVAPDSMRDQFGDATADYTDEGVFNEIEADAPDWSLRTGDGKRKAVAVLTYYRKVDEKRRMVSYVGGGHGYEDEIPEGVEVDPEGPTRVSVKTRVEIYRLTACEVLESTEWPGTLIPLIPVIGEEQQPFDGERRRVGLVSKAKDSQQGYNYAISKALETTALAPKAPFIGYVGQFQTDRDKWATVNTRNWGFLQVDAMTVDGTPAPIPQRVQADMGMLGMALQLVNQFDQDIQASTNVFDPALGNLSPKERSGKAILALQSQAEAGTSHFIQSLAQVTMPYEARVILDAMPNVYDRPGRIVQVLDAEDRPRAVALNAPYQTDQGTGMPRVLPPEMMQALAAAGGNGQPGGYGAQQQGPAPKLHDLAAGRYGSSVTIGKGYASRMQQGAEQLGQVIQADPNLMLVIGDIWARFLDVPASTEIADRMLKVIEQKNPGITSKNGETSPEQMQAQLQAAQGQIQQLQQQLQMAAQALQTDQAKQQAQVQKAQLDNETRTMIAEQDNRTRLLIEQMQLRMDLAIAQLKVGESERQRGHETALQYAQHVQQADHDVQLDEREDARAERAAGRAHALNVLTGAREDAGAERDRQMAWAAPDEGGV